jgi:uncharacterized protein (TIGR02246 family)
MKLVKALFVILSLIILNQNVIYSQTDDVVIIKSEINKSTDAFNKKNLERALSIYSDNYICYYAGHSDQEKKTLKEEFQKIFDNKYLTAKLKVEIVEVQAIGNLGYVRLINVWTYKPTMATEAQIAREKNLQVWEKQSNGNWQIIRASTVAFDIKKSTR